VVVDDLLPYDTINGRMLFARSTDPNEFWVSLLEKAYAKLLGSYDALDAGSAADAILDFTSAVVESWPIRHPIPLPIGMDERSPEIKQRMKAMDEEMDKRWKQLRGYIRSGSLTSCAILPRDNTYIAGNMGTALPFPTTSTAAAMLPDGLMAAVSNNTDRKVVVINCFYFILAFLRYIRCS
jgi:hypothetical protein